MESNNNYLKYFDSKQFLFEVKNEDVNGKVQVDFTPQHTIMFKYSAFLSYAEEKTKYPDNTTLQKLKTNDDFRSLLRTLLIDTTTKSLDKDNENLEINCKYEVGQGILSSEITYKFTLKMYKKNQEEGFELVHSNIASLEQRISKLEQEVEKGKENEEKYNTIALNFSELKTKFDFLELQVNMMNSTIEDLKIENLKLKCSSTVFKNELESELIGIDKRITDWEINHSTHFSFVEKMIKEEEYRTREIIPKSNSNLFLEDYSKHPTSLKNNVTLSENGQKKYIIDSVTTAFTINNEITLLAYFSDNYTIELYNLKESRVIDTLKGHSSAICIVRHFSDKNQNNKEKHYLLSTGEDKKAIVWFYEDNKFINYLTINTGYTWNNLYSALILFEYTCKSTKENMYMSIVTSAEDNDMKVFDVKGECNRTIGNKSYAYFINSFFDKKSNAFKIINANNQNVKVYDFKDGILEKTFKDKENNASHMSAYLRETLDGKLILYESDDAGCFRVWDYNSEMLTKKIVVNGCGLIGFVLWNDKTVIAASSDNSVKVIDLETNKVESIKGLHTDIVCTVVKLKHHTKGEAFISIAKDGKVIMYHSLPNE